MSKRAIAGLALVLSIALLAAAVAGAGTWLFYTESGLQWLSARLSGYGGEDLTLEGVAGTLAGGARVQRIRYAGEDIEVRINQASFSVSALSVLTLSPRIDDLTAAQLLVTTKPTEPRGKPPETLALPVDVVLRNAYVQELALDLGGKPLAITHVRLDYAGGKTEHRIEDLSLSVMGMAAALRGKIDAQPPFALRASFAAVKPEGPQAIVFGTASGNLSALTIDGGANSGEARVVANATLRQYEPQPLANLSAQLTALDLQAFAASLPRTHLSGDIKLERSKEVLAGPIQITNTLPGPYDRDRLPLTALRARIETDLTRGTFTDLTANLGAGGVILGAGRLTPSTAELGLTMRSLNLAALYSTLRATRLAGRAQITIDDKRQSVDAVLKQDDLALSLAATRAGDAIGIARFEAQARGGSARGRAQLSTAQPRPFSMDATFARFDPAAWGAFPRGSLNGELTAQGTLAGPAADLNFAIRDSRWLDAPLAGKGSLSVTSERVRNADIVLTLGGNRISAEGGLGGSRDTLTLRVDAPRLASIDPALRGRMRGTARISGSFRAPRVQFEASATDLVHTRYGAVQSLEARGAVDVQPTGPLDVSLSARGIKTPQAELASASLRIDGTRTAHAALVQAQGARIDFRASARGGWNAGRGWSGTINELVNRGEMPVELAAPVAVSEGPNQARVEPLTLRVMGGVLAVNELTYNAGRISTAGRFNDLPVKPIIALAGGPAEMAGTLRLAGQWSIRNTPQWNGVVTVSRQSGDVTLGAKSPLRIGLESLAIDIKLGERGIGFTAAVRSAVASASAQGFVRPVAGDGPARYTAASPFDFTAEANVARLEPFAAFIDTPMLIRGAAQARLRGTGTLADPLITGPVTAEGLNIALPAEGIDLTGGTLRAMLTAREVRIDSFSIRGGEGVLTAQGTLARIGFDQASLDWQAERFRVLARPDQRLVVSGKGNAGLKDGKVSFTGKLRANEGLFDIGETRLPKLGSDVVIVGRKTAAQTARDTPAESAARPRTQRTQPEPQSQTLSGVALDLTIDLGSQVQVRGQGLQAWLAGDVRLYTNARGALLASGAVNARNGTFVAYGQRLVIDRGIFYFNGPLTNPALDILAMRKRQAVEAGVAVSGTLNNPIVQVVSDPPLPQGEALSWLILGRGPNQASAGELSALPLATGALLGKATGSVAKSLGLDELGLTSSSGNVSEQFLTVGKRLSDRLYVYLEQSLGGAESLLRLEYELTQRIALRAQAGTTSALGIFYRYRWD